MKLRTYICWLFSLLCTVALAQEKSVISPDPASFFMHSQTDSSNYPMLVRAVNVFGNKRTKLYLIEREIAIRTDIFYKTDDLSKSIRLTKEQLMNTGLFVTVDVTMDTILTNEVDVNIQVRERWYLFPVPYFKLVDRNINVWINDYKASLDRTEIGIKILHNNLTGRNDKMNLSLVGGYSQQIVANYYQPFIDKKLTQGLGFGFTMSRTREVNYATDSNRQQFYAMPEFARTSMKAELVYSYRKGSQMRSYLKASYTVEDMDSAIIALNPKMFGDGRTRAEFVDIFANYQYLNVDYIPYPLRGWMVDFYALQRFSKSIPMTQVGGKMQATWRFAKKTYMNFQSSFAFTLSGKEQPYYNSRMLGYRSLYMQGLEYYVADGNWAGMIRSTLRREILSFTLKNLIRSKSHSEIPFRIFLKGYGNLGYAHNLDPGNNFLNNQLLKTAGFGVDIMMVYDMVLKLEYSYNQFGERGFFIHTATDF
ncbi:MAG: hypothetical protein MUE71_11330 [Chitinophagaceae bacterium]|nr:hypothetical protein [Chitinophagaceae bacterium]